MLHDMIGGGMMWGMGLFGLLGLVVLANALLKDGRKWAPKPN